MPSKKINRLSVQQADFVYTICHQEGLSESQAQRVLHLVIAQIQLALAAGATIYLPSIGKLFVRYIPERPGIHPRYRTQITVGPSLRVCFDQSASLRRELEKKLPEFEVFLEDPQNKGTKSYKTLFDSTFGEKVKVSKEQQERATNSPNLVRSHFLTYLKTDFVYKVAWKHPVTGSEFSFEDIHARLKEFAQLDPVGHKVLWYLWTTQKSRVFISDKLNLSASTVKRRLDKAVNTVLLMLLLPELKPENFELFKQSL